MTQKEVSFKVPAILWPTAVVCSAALAVLEAAGIAHCPWWVALLPIGVVIALGLAIVVAAFVSLLLIGGIITVMDSVSNRAKKKESIQAYAARQRGRRLR